MGRLKSILMCAVQDGVGGQTVHQYQIPDGAPALVFYQE